LYEAYGADEAFLTGTFGAQTPVHSIDGKQIGDGKAGQMTKKIQDSYSSRKNAQTLSLTQPFETELKLTPMQLEIEPIV